MGKQRRGTKRQHKTADLSKAPTVAPRSGEGRSAVRWAAITLIAVAIVVYANSLWGVFLFDDAHAIVNNARIRRLLPVERWLSTERPVVELSLAVNYAIGELNPFGYHVFNIAVHVAAALTLFGIVRRTVSLNVKNGTAPAHLQPGIHDSGFALAFAVALLWLVHPLQTESVTYLIQRAESLMGLFYLLTVYFFIRGVQSPRSARWYGAAVVSCALGMASKAVMVTAPGLVLFCDRFFFARSFGEAWRRRWMLYLGFAATWGVLFACGIVQHVFAPLSERTAVGFGFKGVSPWEYALTQSQVMVHYLRLALWPFPLCLDYAWPVARTIGDVILPGALVVGLLVLTAWAFVRRHWTGFAGAWFFLVLAPTSSFIPVRDIAFEHRMYLPLAAVVVLILAGCHAVWNITTRSLSLQGPWRRWVEAAAVLGIAGLWGAGTVLRNRDYHDELGMWTKVIAQRPQNARAHVNVGVLMERAGRAEEAVVEYRIALGLEPDYADAHYNLGVALIRLSRFDEAEQAFREAIRLSSSDPPAHINLAILLGRKNNWDAALEEYREAVRLAPYDQDARLGLARAMVMTRRFEDAFVQYRQMLEIAPNSANVHLSFANALIRYGDFPAAILEFREAARLNPTDVISRTNLGTALSMEGKTDEAVVALRDAVRVAPGDFRAHFKLAKALAEQGNLQEAIGHFTEALAIDPQNQEAIAALAQARSLQDQ